MLTRKILAVIILLGYFSCENVHKCLLYSDKFKDDAINISMSNDSYQFMSLRKYLGGLNTIINQTKDTSLIKEQILIIDNLIKTAQTSNVIAHSKKYKDNYKGWISKSKHESIEIPLYESYSFIYITEFLYILDKIGWKNETVQNKNWWNGTLEFIENNEWKKWRERSYKAKRKYNWYFLRGRTHMGSHWAGLALYLNKLTNDSLIKEQTSEVISQYNKLLRSNLKLQDNSHYIWNATYDNIKGTDASKAEKNIIQDVYHGNHVISYIIASYELGNEEWTKKDILYLVETAKRIYKKDSCVFYDNLDLKSQNWRVDQRKVADGWVKLAVYDNNLKKIFIKYNNCFEKYQYNFQFQANLQYFRSSH